MIHPLPPPQDAARRFLADRTPRTLRVQGHMWRVFDSGPDRTAVLLLPGALGRGATSFAYVHGFEEAGFRAVAPDYPATVETLAEMTDGLAGLLTALGVARAHVVGGSFGGLIAQAFAARHPERIARLGLTDTSGPVPGRAPLLRAAAALLRIVPLGLPRAALDRGIRNYLAELPPGERAPWQAHFDATLAEFSRAEFVQRAHLWAEFDAGRWEAPADGGANVLVVAAAGDRVMASAGLRRRYPRALLHRVSGGHAAALAHPGAYLTLLTEFFGR